MVGANADRSVTSRPSGKNLGRIAGHVYKYDLVLEIFAEDEKCLP